MKKILIRLFATIGLKALSMKVFNTMTGKNISLSSLRYIIGVAKSSNNENMLKKYSKMAMQLYSKNSLGYIEYALLENKYNNKNAINILNKSPSTKETKRILKELKSELIEESNIVMLSDPKKEKEYVLNRLKKDPFNMKIQTRLLNLYQNSNITLPNGFFKVLSSLFSGKKILALTFKTVEIAKEAGNQKKAYNLLMDAQKTNTGDRRILFKLSEILKHDKQMLRAYMLLQVGELQYPVYGAVRRLSFEVDHFLMDNAKETLDKILDYKLEVLLKYMTMVNRVSAYFPEDAEKLIDIRLEIEQELKKNIFSDTNYFNQRIQYLLAGRYVDDIELLFKQASIEKIEVLEESKLWFDKIEKFIKMDKDLSFLGWLKIANQNESTEVLIGLDSGIPIAMDKIEELDKKTVELFIPNSIFTNPKNDKSSFSDVNIMFREIFLYLLKREDIVIIPRHQYNWRYCVPHTTGRKISYHTNHEENDPYWFHIQESTLNGYCSVDTKGFAGYSDIATNFEKIDSTVENIDIELLNENYNTLQEKYVVNNVSKYKQEEVKFEFSEKYVFVALQVMTDVVSNLAYIDGIKLLNIVAKQYANTDTKVIVKRHPYCNSMSVQQTIESLEELALIETSNASIHSIIEGASVIFTVNSGVGLESLMHFKAVVATGECEYAYAAHSVVKTKEELIRVIEEDNFEIDENKVLKFLYFYNKFYVQNKDTISKKLDLWLK